MDIPHLQHRQWGEDFDLIPSFSHYSNGRLAVQLYMPDGEPFGTISTNVASDQIFLDTEFFFKMYSENEQIAKTVVAAGWVELTSRVVSQGFVTFPVARLAGDLLDWYNTLTPNEVQ